MHWGNSEVTGRGLIALAGKGQIYSINLKEGEQYIAHPGYVELIRNLPSYTNDTLIYCMQECDCLHDDSHSSAALQVQVDDPKIPGAQSGYWQTPI